MTTINREFKHLPILYKEMKEEGAEPTDPRVIPALFSVMGRTDTVLDVMVNGAFKKTLRERFDRIKVLWQHNMVDPPIGVPVLLKEIPKEEIPVKVLIKYPEATGALYGEVRYLDTPRGNEVLTGIHEGAITENSIGFDVLKYKWEKSQETEDGLWKPSIRYIQEARLWDVSPVNWGAQEAAQVIKSDGFSALTVAHARLTEYYEHVQKAGRVLSEKNLGKVKAAITALQEVLDAAEPPDEEQAAKSALTANHVFGLMARLNLLTHEV